MQTMLNRYMENISYEQLLLWLTQNHQLKIMKVSRVLGTGC